MQDSATAPLITRDVEYAHGDTRMVGRLVAPEARGPRPGVVLFHDAFGLTEDTLAIATRLAWRGLAVFAADVWGDRLTPTDESQIGPLIASMVGDRPEWLARIAAAHAAAAAQPEVDTAAMISMGYCFGASSALEHLRTGGDVRGVVAIHAGLDLLAPGWESAHFGTRVLVCSGSEDPMATAKQRAALEAGLDAAGVDWELQLYSGTRHAFTNPRSAHSPMPDVVAYHPRSAARAWIATERFLGELIADLAATAA